MTSEKTMREDYLSKLTPRVRAKFDEISALKKPEKEGKALFVSLLELVERRELEKYSHAQKLLVLNHELAKVAWEDFRATGRPVTLGVTMPIGKRSNLEFCAEFSAMETLRMAIKYYADHGKVEQAFKELRGFAERHWHESIAKNFEKYFRKQSENAQVELPEKLIIYLSNARQEEMTERFREMGRRAQVRKDFKKTGKKPD